MKIGVISEGHADRGVIINILTGVTGLDREDIIPLRPIYNHDETDKAALKKEHFSTWSAVKQECEERTLIDTFLLIEGQEFVTIHMDTAEAEEYGIKRPDKKSDRYCRDLRNRMISAINEWMKGDLSAQLLYAIAIEETEAWLLTLHDPKNSVTSAKPKEKLQQVLAKKGINSTSDFDNYFKLSKPLSKPKDLKRGKFLTFNESLKAFHDEVTEKVLPQLIADD